MVQPLHPRVSLILVLLLLVTHLLSLEVFASSELKLSHEFTKDNRLVVYVASAQTTQIRGYDLQFEFDPTQLEIKEIRYHIGSVSKGLGDESETIEDVNKKGTILVRSESIEKDGDTILAEKQALISIVFTGNNKSLNMLKNSAVFYIIGKDGILSKEIAVNEIVVNTAKASKNYLRTKSSGNICGEFWAYILFSDSNPFIVISRMMSWVEQCKK